MLVLGLVIDEFWGVITCFTKESSSNLVSDVGGGGLIFLIPGFLGELGTIKSLYDF